MASFTFHVESRPNGKVIVDVYGEADYPDAADDLKRRARELHAEALKDCMTAWGMADERAAE